MESMSDFFWNKTKRRQEEDAVRYLLARYGLSRRWKQMLLTMREHEEGERGLGLLQFHHLFPCFPVRLVMSECRKPAVDNRFTHMLTKFDQLSMVQEYWATRDEQDAGDLPLGLAMKWPYLRPAPGLIVLHDFSTKLDEVGSRLVCGFGPNYRPLVLECLPNLLDAIDQQIESDDGSAWYDLAEELDDDQS